MNDLEYLKKYVNKEHLQSAIKRLNNGEPVQYIIGNVDFYGYKFNVNKNVLIPRFETEELVEKTIAIASKKFKSKTDILDLGTGSGCIAITLKKKLNCDVDAVDISLEALQVAEENARLNDVDINFIKSNMLDTINKKYDIIISNPPYISKNEEIMDIVKNNEPSLALYAEDDGLYFYEKILSSCKKNLKDNFLIAFEIGYLQGDRIMNMVRHYLDNVDIFLEKDLQSKDRFIFISSK